MFRALSRIIYPSPPKARADPADPIPPSTSTSPSPSPPPPSAPRRLAASSARSSGNNDNADADMLDSRAASSNPRAPASPTSSSSARLLRAAPKRNADDGDAMGTSTKRSRSGRSSLEPASSKRRKVSDESPNEAPDELEHGHGDGAMTKAIARRLDEQGSGAGNYKRMTGPAFDAPIYLGDVVEMRSDGSSTGGWYGCVELIRALKESVTKLRDRDPDKAGDLPQYRSTEVGLQLSWFFSKTDLEALKGDAGRACKGKTAVIGPNERVKTDATDWNWQTMIVSKQPELMYVFNDAYPRRAPLKYTIDWHPLQHYSTRDVRKVMPRTAHFGALETVSRFPDNLPPLPDYYFGVGYPGYEAPEMARAKADGHGPKGEPLPSAGDGVRQIPYVRVGFSFRRQRQAEEEAAHASTAAGKKAKARASSVVHDLVFIKYSSFDFARGTGGSPYNPRKVQRFSRMEWYNVDDLFARGHYRWKGKSAAQPDSTPPAARPGSTSTSSSTSSSPAPPARAPAPYPPVTPQRRRTAQPFTIEIPPPRTPSSRMPPRPAAAAASTSSSSPALPRAARYPPPLARPPPPDHYATDALHDTDDHPYIALHELARCHTVRGGAYGLTGNAYLVDHATHLAHELRLVDNDAQAPEEREELWCTAHGLLASAREWEAEVQKRVRGEGGAAPLAPVWRSTRAELLERLSKPDDDEEGEWVWVDPQVGWEI